MVKGTWANHKGALWCKGKGCFAKMQKATISCLLMQPSTYSFQYLKEFFNLRKMVYNYFDVVIIRFELSQAVQQNLKFPGLDLVPTWRHLLILKCNLRNLQLFTRRPGFAFNPFRTWLPFALNYSLLVLNCKNRAVE